MTVRLSIKCVGLQEAWCLSASLNILTGPYEKAFMKNVDFSRAESLNVGLLYCVFAPI